MNQTREFCLPIVTLVVNSDFNRPNGTHVIEISAFYQVKAELEVAQSEIKKLKAELDRVRSYSVLKRKTWE